MMTKEEREAKLKAAYCPMGCKPLTGPLWTELDIRVGKQVAQAFACSGCGFIALFAADERGDAQAATTATAQHVAPRSAVRRTRRKPR
jgi:RNase P subunit RPR2